MQDADGRVPAGWPPSSWVERLRYLADKCQASHPEVAASHRAWADAVEQEHGVEGEAKR